MAHPHGAVNRSAVYDCGTCISLAFRHCFLWREHLKIWVNKGIHTLLNILEKQAGKSQAFDIYIVSLQFLYRIKCVLIHDPVVL